jgi:Ser/Thr protein kinase RdoA (MazF antagonist)
MQPRRWQLVSTFAPETTRRPSYRVELRDGRTVKVRGLLDEVSAAQVHQIRAALPIEAFPPVLLRHGRVFVEPWVEGSPLASGPVSEAQVVAAAALLAQVHAVEEIAGRKVRSETATTEWLERTTARLEFLLARGAIREDCFRSLRDAQRRWDPGTARVGVIHGDFCAENIVVDPAGRLFVIDNEDFSLDPLDYDLGLTWYGWPLPAPAFALFLDTYARRAQRSVPPLSFWKIAAVVKGAAIRVQLFPDGAGVAIDRLEHLAAELAGRRSSSPDGARP